ncbi:MAG TPA: hypothetical protein VGP72_26050 [Planctomycetota bacterium]|jgi:hypothetical protein
MSNDLPNSREQVLLRGIKHTLARKLQATPMSRPDIIDQLGRLAAVLKNSGKHARAEKVYRCILHGIAATHMDYPHLHLVLMNYADVLRHLQRTDDARKVELWLNSTRNANLKTRN